MPALTVFRHFSTKPFASDDLQVVVCVLGAYRVIQIMSVCHFWQLFNCSLLRPSASRLRLNSHNSHCNCNPLLAALQMRCSPTFQDSVRPIPRTWLSYEWISYLVSSIQIDSGIEYTSTDRSGAGGTTHLIKYVFVGVHIPIIIFLDFGHFVDGDGLGRHICRYPYSARGKGRIS